MSNPLERMRTMQAMLFGTAAGENLRELLMTAGHFYEAVETEQARIEENLVKRLFQACGAAIELHPRALPESAEAPANLIDQALEDQNDVL